MATHQLTPHRTQPRPFPKPQLYEAIFALNRDLELVVQDLHNLREFRFSRSYIDAFIVKAEDLRAWSNAEFLERQLAREMKDWNHWSALDRKFEQRFRDPNDVLIDAERRMKQLASEEQQALAEARRIRKRRKIAEKQRTATNTN